MKYILRGVFYGSNGISDTLHIQRRNNRKARELTIEKLY
jgi:hypothetical protein